LERGGPTEGERDDQGRRGRLAPEQQEERFSTGGLGFEESLRRVLVRGPDDENKGEEAMEHSGVAESDLTDEELMKRMADAQARLRDGSAQVFYDDESLITYWENRSRG
jgi:hypothetical protein